MATRGLIGLYDIGSSGMRAARAVMGTTGKNITHAGTPGYSRQTQILSATPFSGVTLGGIQRSHDAVLLAREQLADATLARADDLRAALESVEAGLTGGDVNLVDAIANLFGGFVELSAAPTSAPLRRQAIERANSASVAFQRAAGQVAEGRAAADGALTQLAQSASRLATAIAETSASIRGGNADPAVLDERDRLCRELASIAGGSAQVGSDGATRFVLDSGHVLVDGDRASALVTRADPGNGGHLQVAMQAGGLTHALGPLAGGRIGGIVDARDRVLGGIADRIDQLAYDLSSAVNQAHSGAQGLDGTSGRDLFVQPASVRGAAAAMALDPAIRADERALATGTIGGGPGDNGGARALAAVRDAPSARGGGTLTDEGIDTLAHLGAEISRASTQLQTAQAHSDFLTGLRDARSGVSVEEELSRLAEIQHAHSAAAQFVRAVDETYGDLLARI